MDQDLYEYHQRTNSKVQRLLKSKNPAEAINVLLDAIQCLSKSCQWNSLFECSFKLLEIFQKHSFFCESATASICFICNCIEESVKSNVNNASALTANQCSKFFSSALLFSKTTSEFKNGHSELNLRFGVIFVLINEFTIASKYLTESLHRSSIDYLMVCIKNDNKLLIPVLVALLKKKNFQFCSILLSKSIDCNSASAIDFCQLLLRISLIGNSVLFQELLSYYPQLHAEFKSELSSLFI